MNKKKIAASILLIVFAGAIIAYKMYNKPHVNVAETSSDITISTKALLEAFSSNETTANAKYLEKIIEVSGVVSEIKNEKGKGIVTLTNADSFGSVLCHLSLEATQKTNTIKEGQTITVKGICTGYLMDVILVKCELIN